MADFNQNPGMDLDSYDTNARTRDYVGQLRDEGYSSNSDVLGELGDIGDMSIEELTALLNDGDDYSGEPVQQQQRKPVANPNQPAKFNPYQFKGTYDELGEVALDIQNAEQLDGYLEKAVMADKLYEKYQELEASHEENKEFAELGRDLQEQLENDPGSFINKTIADLFFTGDPKAVLKYIQGLYHNLNDRLGDGNAYRAAQLEWQASNQPQQQSRMAQDELSLIQEERNKLNLETETRKLEGWKSGMNSKYADIISHISRTSGDNKWFDKQVQLVMERGMNQVRSGKPFGPKQLEAELRELIAPIYNVFQKGAKPSGVQKNAANKNYKPQMNQGTGTSKPSQLSREALKKKYQESLYNR